MSIASLLDPGSIAVVGASPGGGRGTRTLLNLRGTGFAGEIFAVNPRYQDVLGFKCYPSVADLPGPVDCLVVAVGADAACEVLESAYRRGIRAAVVLAAGFGEGGHGEARAERLRVLGAGGMSICGPNCYGLISITSAGAASAYSGRLPTPLRAGPVALVSQSGGLGNGAFTPLMADRALGFRYVVSCGNQIATAIEDYVAYFAQAPDVEVIAAVVESIRDPRKLLRAARAAHERDKSLVFLQVGCSRAGAVMSRSHTGALASDHVIAQAHLRRCGIVSADSYDEFVEAIELLAVARRDAELAREVVVISGSGGGAAVAADALEGTGMTLPEFSPAIRERIRAAMPDFGNVTNPLDGTGALADDPAVLPRLLDAVLADDRRAIVATTVTARQTDSEKERRFARSVAQAARATARQMVAFQHSPLGGPLDAGIVQTLHDARVPMLLGGRNAMRVLAHLPRAREYRAEVRARDWSDDDRLDAAIAKAAGASAVRWDFLAARAALVEAGIAVIDAHLATSEADAVAAWRRFAAPVALKAEAPGLMHKSDIGCVALDRAGDAAVVEGYRAIVRNAARAGLRDLAGILVQPMMSGIAEAYAGIINDPAYGPAICCGLGGIHVELFGDTATELAPLTRADAMRMVARLRAAPLLTGARGRGAGDVDALAELLVRLGRFAVANFGRFRSLDLNPIIVGAPGRGAIAVDIAVEPLQDQAIAAANVA